MPRPYRFIALALVAVVAAAGCSGSQHPPATPTPHVDVAVAQAIRAYSAYVNVQLAALATATSDLASAIDAGDRRQAQRLYPAARIHYERIEPVAEIWGQLDFEIDGRINDFVPSSAFAGFHRIEQILWTQPSADARPVMADLVANVKRLRRLAGGTHYTSLELSSGATELLNEIEATKITGEEERYSHLDLVDIRGNVDGAEKVIDAFRFALRTRAPALLTTIGKRSAQVERGLASYTAHPGYDHSGYVRFDRVTPGQRRQLSDLIEALAQAISLTTGALNT